MKLMKIIAFAAAGTLMTCLAACGSGDGASDSLKESSSEEGRIVNEVLGDEFLPDYTSDKEFTFYPYGGVPGKLRVYDADGQIVEDNVPISDEQLLEYYTQMKDAGINVATGGYINMTYSDYIRGLKVCEKIGLKMMVYDANLVNILMNTKSDAVAVDNVLENYSEMLESPAFYGISVDDEPTPAELSGFKTALRRWKLIAPDKMFYINLFPSIAFSNPADGTFEDYVKKFCEEVDVDYVCYDHYPLVTSARTGNYLVDNFLYNLVTVKKNSSGRRAFTVLQSVKYGGSHRALESAKDVTFQVYSALACGYEGMGWFTFWPPVPFDGATNFGDAAYNRRTNTPTETYYAIKDGLNEARKFENVIFNFDWKGIMTVIGTMNDNGGENNDFALSAFACTDSPDIRSIVSERDTLVGVFEGKNGESGYMFVNYTEPSKDLSDEISIGFDGYTKAAVYGADGAKVYSLSDGKLSVTIGGGGSVFVVPLK